jgi:hypothetical protein
MSLFTPTVPLTGANIEQADLSFINFNQVAAIETFGPMVLFIYDTEFYLYANFNTTEEAQNYTMTLVGDLD